LARKESLFSRRVGPLGVLLIVAVGVALTYGIVQVIPKPDEDEPVAKATPTAVADCREVDPPYGPPPDGFEYRAVEESKRAQTVKALRLDESEGKVDVRDVTQTTTGIALGSLVGVPSKTPAKYASSLVAAAEVGGSKVSRGKGYAIVPLESGRGVAVGVKGCRTVLFTAQDPNAVRAIAAVLFTA